MVPSFISASIIEIIKDANRRTSGHAQRTSSKGIIFKMHFETCHFGLPQLLVRRYLEVLLTFDNPGLPSILGIIYCSGKTSDAVRDSKRGSRLILNIARVKFGRANRPRDDVTANS